VGIDFTYYPTSNRVPGVYVEMDPSQASAGTVLQNTLLIGQISSAGTATPNIPFMAESVAQVQAMCGLGSMLSQMAIRYMQRDSYGPLYLLPLSDNASGAQASGTVTISGPATAAGTLNLYIGGTLVQCFVNTGDAAAVVSANLAAAINALVDIGVTATQAGGAVTIKSNGKGAIFNDIDLRFNYRGSAGGEAFPPGITGTVTAMAGGSANPDITPGLANLSSQPFDFIGLPYTDTTNLNAMKAFLADDVGRWAWSQMIYGGAFSAYRGTLGACTTFGEGRNDQHVSIMAFYDSPDSVWLWTAEIVAQCANSLRVDPGLPLQYISTTLKAPPIQSQWTIGERNTLLYSGMSTFRVADDGTVSIERMCTTYQTNAAGAPSTAYLDVETMFGLTYVSRDLVAFLLQRYARKKLVSDATQILAGSNCVNSLMIKASVTNEYRTLEASGYVQNSTIFAQSLVVENAGNGLVKVLAPVDLVQQLRQIAILLQFRKS
jgi:phage tail sheath gpL-like